MSEIPAPLQLQFKLKDAEESILLAKLALLQATSSTSMQVRFGLFSALKIDIFYKILLTLIALVLSYQENYFDGRTDILVFSILSIITKNLYDFFYNKEYNKLNSFEFLISLNLLLWIKSECLLYVISIYLAIIFFFKGNQKTKFFFTF